MTTPLKIGVAHNKLISFLMEHLLFLCAYVFTKFSINISTLLSFKKIEEKHLIKIQVRENKNTFPESILTQGYRTQVMLMLTRVLCQTMSWFHEQSQNTEHKMIFYFESSFFSWWLSLLITPLICHRKPSYLSAILSAIHKVIERKKMTL